MERRWLHNRRKRETGGLYAAREAEVTTAIGVGRTREARPRLVARLAGVFYFAAVFTAVFSEFFARQKPVFVSVVLPVGCYVIVTFLLYHIFQPVSRMVALVALIFGVAGLAFEGMQWQPGRMNAGMILHGVYCLLIGYLILKSTFLPRVLGVLMVFAGMVWLLDLLRGLAHMLSPYNAAAGLLGEGLPMLWLLAIGVNDQQWKEQTRIREGLQ